MSKRWMTRDCPGRAKSGALLLGMGLGLVLACHSFTPPAMSLVAGKNTITQGTSTTLTAYLPGGGGEGTIDQGIGTVSNGVPVTISPKVDTTYTLTFNGYFGSLTASTTVAVVPGAVLTSFTAAESLITAGTGTTLTAVFSGGTGSVDQGIGPVLSGVPVPTGDLSSGKTYTLTVTNAAGARLTATTTVTLAGAPTTPVITAPPLATAGTAGLTASVPAQTDCTYAWTITGGEITAGAATTTVTFTAGASGSVVLGCTVTNAAGTGSAPGTATVAILALPGTPVITAPAAATAGATGLSASVPATAGSSYAWTITGGTITAGTGTAAITFTAGASGSVVLGCTVTNAAGTAGSPGSATVTIVAAPGTPVITAPATVTAGATGLAASVPATAGSSYAWTITGGTITAGTGTAAITFTAGASGTVVLGCTVTNAAGTAGSPGSATVTIVAAPGTPVITAPAVVTAGATGLAASVPATAGSSYAWTITGGTITAGTGTAAITFTAGASGTVVLGCTVTNAAGTAGSPGSATVTIVAAPGTPVITAPATVTAGATGLAASVPATAGSSYAWTITGGTITAGTGTAAITFTAGASGTVVLGCTVTNAAGTAGSPGSATVTIVAAPATPVITAPAAVTAGTTGNTASVPAQAGSTYAWTVGDGTLTAGAGTTSITFTAGVDAGPVTLGCVVTNAAGTASAPGTASVAIVAAPTAAITGPASVAPGSTGNTASVPVQAGSTYAWTIGDGTITAGSGTDTITFTAGTDAGPVVLGCVVTNSLGAASAPGTDSIPISSGSSLVSALVSDASTEDWATIGVKVQSVALVPQGGGDPVVLYSAAPPVPTTNLVQLDQLSELLGGAQAPAGTYTGAVLTLGGNPGDVVLVTAADPSPGFQGPAATAIPPEEIQIQGAAGDPGSLAVRVQVDLATPLVVAAGQPAALDLEFDLAHPAFIIEHWPAGDPQPVWAVNFNGPVRHHPAAASDLVLRHIYGTVGAVAPDGASLTAALDLPGSAPVTVLADAGDGTLFTDLDAGTSGPVPAFAGALAGKCVRIAARFQADGSLVAARLWASSSPGPVHAGPEGHLLHVDPAAGLLTVEDPSGAGVQVRVDPATRFFFRDPADPARDAAPIGAGAGFLGGGLVRGFKVHASVDPADPATARIVEIEAARYDGVLSALSSAGLTCVRTFATAADDYTMDLAFSRGASVGIGAAAAAGPLAPRAVGYATWGDPAAPAAWSAKSAGPEAVPLSGGTVASPWSGTSFALALATGILPVDLDLAPATATLAFQVDRTGGTVTVTPLDLTTAAGQGRLAGILVPGAAVQVFALPEPGGRVLATALLAYTGVPPW